VRGAATTVSGAVVLAGAVAVRELTSRAQSANGPASPRALKLPASLPTPPRYDRTTPASPPLPPRSSSPRRPHPPRRRSGRLRLQVLGGQEHLRRLTISDASYYGWNRGERGRYTTSGRNITFTSGPLKGVYKHAQWRNNGSMFWINLYDRPTFGHVSTDVQCVKRRGA
jgi:hypothetical protein